MEFSANDLDQRMQHFEKVCRDEGVKLTHQRIEIFREVAQTEDHPDAEQIFRRVRKRMPTVSLDTVYRTLLLLHDLGLVVTLGSSRGRTRFDANLDNHHHFVCARCGFTRDFSSQSLEGLRLPDSVGTFGKVESTHIEVKGICLNCMKKNTAD